MKVCPDAGFRILFDNCIVSDMDGVRKETILTLNSVVLFTCLTTALLPVIVCLILGKSEISTPEGNQRAHPVI